MKLIKIIICGLILGLVLVVITQDFLIFPGAVRSWKGLLYQGPPQGLEESKLVTTDGERITTWRIPAQAEKRRQVGVLMHGNAEVLSNFVWFQKFFSELGITNYAYDYRGYGTSTGWPSEKGLYLDGEAVVEEVLKREKIEAKDLIIFGHSIGTGIAAYLAQKYQVGTLILISPYANLREHVQRIPLLGYLSSFLWYDLSTKKYVAKLKNTCLIIVHGKLDRAFSIEEAEEIKRSYRGDGGLKFILMDKTDHYNTLPLSKTEIARGVGECIFDQSLP